jgi:hypothetical protein
MLQGKGLSNYWGYHSIGFFAPDVRYSSTGQLVIALGTFEQAELDPGRVLGEQGEVHALAIPGGPEGVGTAGSDLH